jgi:hypothetical protein
MPSSTLLQLVARGRQDAYLTSNPQMTFFKQVYRRYTNFAIESIPIEFDGVPNFGRRISCLIPRKAELISSLFVEIELPPLPQTVGQPTNYWVNDIGNFLIKDVSVEIGEQEIDKHLNTWLQIWAELTVPADQRDGYNEMVGHWDVYPPSAVSYDITQPLLLTVPLRFWFCNTIGAALPLIALQAHTVRLIMHLSDYQDCVWNTNYPPPPGQPCPYVPPVEITRFQLYGDYVFLDKVERQRFASADHEYLIDQLQYTPVQTLPAGLMHTNVPLYFNHCCKEFLWTIQLTRMQTAHEWFNFSNRLVSNGGDPWAEADLLATSIIRLDGYDRFHERGARYFRLTQPYQHHTRIPQPPYNIYDYAFDLKPEDQQPTGSINCSRIDDIQLHVTFNPNWLNYERTVMVYTQNYNVLRIVGGLGGVAFIA